MTNYTKGDRVFITYAKFGLAEVLTNGRKNTFNDTEKIYKVRSIVTGETTQFNSLHFKPIL